MTESALAWATVNIYDIQRVSGFVGGTCEEADALAATKGLIACKLKQKLRRGTGKREIANILGHSLSAVYL